MLVHKSIFGEHAKHLICDKAGYVAYSAKDADRVRKYAMERGEMAAIARFGRRVSLNSLLVGLILWEFHHHRARNHND